MKPLATHSGRIVFHDDHGLLPSPRTSPRSMARMTELLPS